MGVESYQKIHPKILKCGRLTYCIPKDIPNEEIEEYIQKEQDTDPSGNPLEPLSSDVSKEWVINLKGDSTMISSLNGEVTSNRQVVHLENMNWKGCHNIYDPYSHKWAFFYCGFGLNKAQGIYPMKFYKIQKTSMDKKEYPEPNGEVIEEQEEGEGNNEELEGNEDIPESNTEVDKQESIKDITENEESEINDE